MTRINLIPPVMLKDQHLLAEIKEINQLAGQFKKSCFAGTLKGAPTSFTLGTGHVKFFYDKGAYLHNRFNNLKVEAIRRGFKIVAEFNNVWIKLNLVHYYNEWTPTSMDYSIILDRITSKINMKPHFYTYSGVNN